MRRVEIKPNPGDVWPLGADPISNGQRLERVWNCVIKRDAEDLQRGLDQGYDVNEWFNTHANAGYDEFRRWYRSSRVVGENDRMQAIHMATFYKWLGGVEQLLKSGADANTFDFRTKSKIHPSNTSYTPLMYACCDGSLPLVKLLVSHGADVTVFDRESNSSPMSLALTYLSFPIVQLLHERGATISTTEARNVSIQDCIQAFNDPAMKVPRARLLQQEELEEKVEEVKQIALTVLTVLFNSGADPNEIQGEGMPAIHTCLQGCTDDLRCLELLVSKGADINSYYEASYTYNYTTLTPLFAATLTRGAEKAVSWLIQHGANVDGIFQPRYRCQLIGEPYSMLMNLLEDDGYEQQAFALVKAGSSVSPQNIVRMRELREVMKTRQATFFELAGGTHPLLESGMEILNDMIDFVSQPKTLSWSIRTTLRCKYGITQPHVIEKLPLPNALKKYIMCMDL